MKDVYNATDLRPNRTVLEGDEPVVAALALDFLATKVRGLNRNDRDADKVADSIGRLAGEIRDGQTTFYEGSDGIALCGASLELLSDSYTLHVFTPGNDPDFEQFAERIGDRRRLAEIAMTAAAMRSGDYVNVIIE